MITDDGPILSNAVHPADEVQYMVVNGGTQLDRQKLIESSEYTYNVKKSIHINKI